MKCSPKSRYGFRAHRDDRVPALGKFCSLCQCRQRGAGFGTDLCQAFTDSVELRFGGSWNLLRERLGFFLECAFLTGEEGEAYKKLVHVCPVGRFLWTKREPEPLFNGSSAETAKRRDIKSAFEADGGSLGIHDRLDQHSARVGVATCNYRPRAAANMNTPTMNTRTPIISMLNASADISAPGSGSTFSPFM